MSTKQKPATTPKHQKPTKNHHHHQTHNQNRRRPPHVGAPPSKCLRRVLPPEQFRLDGGSGHRDGQPQPARHLGAHASDGARVLEAECQRWWRGAVGGGSPGQLGGGEARGGGGGGRFGRWGRWVIRFPRRTVKPSESRLCVRRARSITTPSCADVAASLPLHARAVAASPPSPRRTQVLAPRSRSPTLHLPL
jgi:hypothetical protein